MASSKISPDTIERFFILTIYNKHAKNAPILQSLLKISASNIDVFSHFFCWRVKNLDSINVCIKSEAKKRIKFKNNR